MHIIPTVVSLKYYKQTNLSMQVSYFFSKWSNLQTLQVCKRPNDIDILLYVNPSKKSKELVVDKIIENTHFYSFSILFFIVNGVV